MQTTINTKKMEDNRGTWSNKLEFILSCIGFSVGLANVWRFPYVAYENGGGTFQLPYVILLILMGIPLYFMEIARGQYSRLGPVAVWKSCPIGMGIGWAMITTSIVGKFYYNVLLAYSVVYMASSFTATLPWENCEKWWGATDDCYVRTANLTSDCNATLYPTECDVSSKETSSKQYWERFVLNIHKSNGIHDPGKLQWKIVSGLAFTWFCVFICVFKGIKSMGKAVYVTATFPYVILIIFLIQSAFLDGAGAGIEFFFTPSWEKLGEAETWMNAARQMVYSLGLANGALITLASYNRFHNTCHRDAIIVANLDFLTSLLASFVIFSVLGALAKDLHIPIRSVFASGQGLAFIIFPEVVTRLPVPQIWCFAFFFMIFILGIDSTFTSFESVWTAIMDEHPHLRKHQSQLYFISIIFFFLLGLPFSTAGGQYLLNLVDYYNTTCRTLLVTSEVIAVMWIYGLERFSEDVNEMLGFRPNLYFKISWVFVSPVVLVILTIMSWINFTPPVYGTYEYPFWAQAFGWVVVSFSICQIPLGACIALYKHWRKGNIWGALKPTPEWGPSMSDKNEAEVSDSRDKIELDQLRPTESQL